MTSNDRSCGYLFLVGKTTIFEIEKVAQELNLKFGTKWHTEIL